MDRKLSNDFWLSEFTKSQTALRHGIKNRPSEKEIENLISLCDNVLQPLRDAYNKPVIISSGYRCLELNRKLKSSDSSQHIKGQAADFEILGYTNFDVASWIKTNLIFDQLILEMYNPDEGPNSGWIHCSYNSSGNRKEVLTYLQSGKYVWNLIR